MKHKLFLVSISLMMLLFGACFLLISQSDFITGATVTDNFLTVNFNSSLNLVMGIVFIISSIAVLMTLTSGLENLSLEIKETKQIIKKSKHSRKK